MNIDAHQHFWIYDPQQHPWINDSMRMLRRNFLPADLAVEQTKVRFDGSIAVQARQTLEESRWLLGLAEQDTRIKGVVGWVDLRSDQVVHQLRELAAHEKFVGVRHVLQDEADDRFMLGTDFLRGIARLKELDLTYDILIYPKHLAAAIGLVERFPEQPFVLDHLAKPCIRDHKLSPWAEHVRRLAQLPNVLCKVSGLVTEAAWRAWKQEDFRPYLEVAWEAFGEDRLMIGSDWPVCLVSGSYEEVVGIVKEFFQPLSETAREKIFGGNASKFYGV